MFFVEYFSSFPLSDLQYIIQSNFCKVFIIFFLVLPFLFSVVSWFCLVRFIQIFAALMCCIYCVLCVWRHWPNSWTGQRNNKLCHSLADGPGVTIYDDKKRNPLGAILFG